MSTALAYDDMTTAETDTVLVSPIASVTDDAWTRFVCGMITQEFNAVSRSNALGLFEMMPRRLADLGIVSKLTRTRWGGRTIWAADFVFPMTSAKFLKNPQAQYMAFSRSMVAYADRIANGEISKPVDMKLSRALAILHKCGPKGLDTWMLRERFPATVKLVSAVADIF